MAVAVAAIAKATATPAAAAADVGRSSSMLAELGVNDSVFVTRHTGVILLVFMVNHLLQFRFGATEPFPVRPPPYLINFGGILRLQLFWTEDTAVKPVEVRNIYKVSRNSSP